MGAIDDRAVLRGAIWLVFFTLDVTVRRGEIRLLFVIGSQSVVTKIYSHRQSWSMPVYVQCRWSGSCSEFFWCSSSMDSDIPVPVTSTLMKLIVPTLRATTSIWSIHLSCDFYSCEEFLFDGIFSYWMDLVTIACILIDRTNGCSARCCSTQLKICGLVFFDENETKCCCCDVNIAVCRPAELTSDVSSQHSATSTCSQSKQQWGLNDKLYIIIL
jgi:hypothetical protein